MLTKTCVLVCEFAVVWAIYYSYAWLSQSDLSLGVLTALLFATDKLVAFVRNRLSRAV
ncbi:MAG: hypothetical protein AAFR93_09660 [Pseudomonadota bacterium]